jgi:enoyl-CoA hydratase
MELQNVLFEVRNQIAYVTVNRPKVLNALNDQTMEELKNVFLEIRHRSDALAAILTGTGDKAFIAGADINELATQTPIKERSFPTGAYLGIIEPVNLLLPHQRLCSAADEISMACTLRLASDNEGRTARSEVVSLWLWFHKIGASHWFGRALELH